MNKQGAGKVLRSRAVTVQLVLLSIMFCVEVEAETTEQTHTYNQPKIFPIKVTQGVAVDGGYFYAISNTRIDKCDKQTGEVVATWAADKRLAAQEHFKHLNSGVVIGNKLYAAHSRFPIAPNDSSVEIFELTSDSLKHMRTIPMPAGHGSLTWIDRHKDGSWWMCYAVYGKTKNKQTKLIKYRYEDGQFSELKTYSFPNEVVARWGSMSSSGGSWGPDGLLYTTGHDHAEAYVLEPGPNSKLKYVRTEKNMGFYGQGIAWDRFTQIPVLWGIVKNKKVCATRVAAIK